MRLTADEQTWLDAYCQVLKEQHLDVVDRMVIYGSKARGDDHPDSDLDVLLIVKNEAAHLKRQLRRIGYELAATSDAVPSILAYTQDEWESRRESGSPFRHHYEAPAPGQRHMAARHTGTAWWQLPREAGRCERPPVPGMAHRRPLASPRC